MCIRDRSSGLASSGGISNMLQLDNLGNNNGDGGKITFSRAGTIRTEIEALKNETSNNETDIVFRTTNAGSLGEKLRINSTGELISTNGTLRRNVSDSSFTVSGDTASNTGANINLYGASHASLANVFRVRTGSTERLRINQHGNIGIGGTGTDQRLNVSGNIELNAYEDPNGQNGYYYQKGLIIGNAYDAGKGSISGVSDDRNAIIWQERGLNIDFATNNIHRMTLTYDGNLGIGTNNPTGAAALTNNSTTLAVGTLKATTINGNITGTLTGAASQLAMTDQSGDSTCFPVFVQASGTGNLSPHSNTSLTFNASTAELGASILKSTIATGTAPLTVTSTTTVTNLSADLLDGRDTSNSGGNDKVMITNSSGNTSLGSGTFLSLIHISEPTRPY